MRRQHTSRTVHGWIVAGLLIVLLGSTSCSFDDVTSDPSNVDQHLRLAGSTFGVQTLDPALVRDVETAFLSRQIFRGLMRLDNDLSPVPDLAASVAISNDGLVYTFMLHDGLTFHHGNALNAAAVVRSFNRATDPALAGGRGADLPAATYLNDIAGIDERLDGTVATISGIRAVDDLTVEITLKRPVVTFLMKLTGSPAAIVDAQQATSTTWWHEANGSGPFRINRYTAGTELELTAFDGYAGGRPRLDRITIRFGTGAMQPLNLYESGQIDVTGVPGWAIDRIESPVDPLHRQLVVTEELSTTYLAFNPNIEPYTDLHVRGGIAAGFDIHQMVELAFNDRVSVANGLIPPGIGNRRWDSVVAGYDLDAARESLTTLDGAEIVEPGAGISSILQATLQREAGATIIVVDQPWPEFAERLPRRDLPAFVLTWIADYPDPENTLATLLRTGSPDNFSGYSNQAFDELVDMALVETDPDERARLYLEAQQIALDDVAVIPLYHGMSYTLVQPWVRGLDVTEIGILGLESIWIESEPS